MTKKTFKEAALPLYISPETAKVWAEHWRERLDERSEDLTLLLRSNASPREKLRAISDYEKAVDNFHRLLDESLLF